MAEVPLVDVINTILDSSFPLKIQEYKQWENPNVKADYDYMMTYSPLDNLKKNKLSQHFDYGGLNDSRVAFHKPTK